MQRTGRGVSARACNPGTCLDGLTRNGQETDIPVGVLPEVRVFTRGWRYLNKKQILTGAFRPLPYTPPIYNRKSLILAA